MPMLTTLDNPNNPYDDYDAWRQWDRNEEYFTEEYIARVISLLNIEIIDGTIPSQKLLDVYNFIITNDNSFMYVLIDKDQ